MNNNTKERVLLYLILAVAIIFFVFTYKAVKVYENGLASLSATQVYVCSCEAPKVEKKVSKPIVKPTPKPQPQPVPKPIGPLPPNGPTPNPTPNPLPGSLPPNGPNTYNPPVYSDLVPTYNPLPPSGPTYEPQAPMGPLPSN